MKNTFARGTVRSADVGRLQASLTDATHATVDGVVFLLMASGDRVSTKNQWKLEKRDDRWLIVETKRQ